MRHIQQTGPSWKRLWAIGAFGFAAIVAGSAVASAPFNGLVVFGTSLSDPGNAFALVGRSGTPPEYLFWDGIHRTMAGHALIAEAAAAALAQHQTS
jgi:phospholipase/lecithinase/hemolysin